MFMSWANLVLRQKSCGNPEGTKQIKKTANSVRISGLEVVPTGIEPVTQGFSVLCSTN